MLFVNKLEVYLALLFNDKHGVYSYTNTPFSLLYSPQRTPRRMPRVCSPTFVTLVGKSRSLSGESDLSSIDNLKKRAPVVRQVDTQDVLLVKEEKYSCNIHSFMWLIDAGFKAPPGQL